VKNKTKIQWFTALGAAFAWFGNQSGAGFCSGITLLNYFSNAGWMSLLTTLLPFIILAFVFYYMGEYSRLIHAESYKDVATTLYSHNKSVGQVMLFVFDLVVVVCCIVNSSAVLAGAATFLDEAMGLNYTLGTLITLAIVVLISMFGATIMARIDLPLGIIMTVAILVVAGVLINENSANLGQIIAKRQTFDVTATQALLNALTYTGMQAGFCSAYIAIAGKFTSKGDNKVMAISGMLINGGMLFIVSLAVLSQMPGISGSLIPIYDMLIERFGVGSILTVIYGTGLFLAYISISDVVAVISRFAPWLNRKQKYNQNTINMAVGIFILVVSLAFAQFGILAIIKTGYSVVGFLRWPTFILGGLVFAPWRIHQMNKKKRLQEEAQN
jgi:uncharacterized membrane protein YkvI